MRSACPAKDVPLPACWLCICRAEGPHLCCLLACISFLLQLLLLQLGKAATPSPPEKQDGSKQQTTSPIRPIRLTQPYCHSCQFSRQLCQLLVQAEIPFRWYRGVSTTLLCQLDKWVCRQRKAPQPSKATHLKAASSSRAFSAAAALRASCCWLLRCCACCCS
jgi:hypothetical protein